MAEVVATRRLPGDAFQRIEEAGHALRYWQGDCPPPRKELLALVAGAEGLITTLEDKIDAEVMDAAGPGLKVIAQYAVGVDNIDLEAAKARGIRVTNTPGVLTEATADLAFALLLAAARRVAEGDRFVREGRWQCWLPSGFLGPEVAGAKVLVVGFGRIGQAFAKRAKGFGMEILYTSRAPKPEAEAALGARRVALDEALPEADFVSLHVPLTPETERLFDEARLFRMKPSSVLINTARGKVVDTEALVRALKEGPLFAAGLDVTDPEPLPQGHPLTELENVVLTPHVGSAGRQTRERMARMVAENLLAVLSGREPPNPVV